MTIASAVLMCHAPIVLPQIAGDEAARCQATTAAMHQAARALLLHEPDVVVLVSPHAPRERTRWGISHERTLSGSFARFGHRELALSFSGAPDAARALVSAAQDHDLPTRALPAYDLDHGSLVPMWFLHCAQRALCREQDAAPTRFSPRILLVALPYPSIDAQHEVRFGEAVASAASACGERWAVLASGDMSHRLSIDAPGGFDARAAEFDERFVAHLQRGDLRGAIELPAELIERAGQDVVQSTAVAAGAVAFSPLGAHTLGYEGPFGVGYCEAVLYDEARAHATLETMPAPPAPPAALVELALAAIAQKLRDERRIRPASLAAPWDQPRAVFVTLRSPDGTLRGCVGRTKPLFPSLAEEVVDCAIGAALRDPRMPHVTADELPTLQVEVSVLAAPEPIASPSQLDPARYGVIVEQEMTHETRRGLLLPAIDGIDTVADQLRVVAHKAGLDPSLPYRMERFTVDKVARKT